MEKVMTAKETHAFFSFSEFRKKRDGVLYSVPLFCEDIPYSLLYGRVETQIALTFYYEQSVYLSLSFFYLYY